MESIVCNTIDNHLEQNNLLNEKQWGFRKDRSTQLALLSMTEQWRKHLDNNNFVGVLFLDFRKAFDSVNHDVIKTKLTKNGITGNLNEWIMNYLTNRKQITIVNGQSSEEEDVDIGVPQGSLIGPRAFLVTVNDCPDISDEFETDLFADDNTSYCADPNLDQLFTKIQRMINNLSAFYNRNLSRSQD